MDDLIRLSRNRQSVDSQSSCFNAEPLHLDATEHSIERKLERA